MKSSLFGRWTNLCCYSWPRLESYLIYRVVCGVNNDSTRGNAVLALVYVALIHQKLEKRVVKPVLLRARRDPKAEVRAHRELRERHFLVLRFTIDNPEHDVGNEMSPPERNDLLPVAKREGSLVDVVLYGNIPIQWIYQSTRGEGESFEPIAAVAAVKKVR